MNFFDTGINFNENDSDTTESTESDEESESSQSDHEEKTEIQNNIKEENETSEQISLLPSVQDAFSEIKGPPAFLIPEATKPLAMNPDHLKYQEKQINISKNNINDNIKLNDQKEEEMMNKKEKSSGPVIEARAKKYKPEDIIAQDEIIKKTANELKMEYLKRGTPAMELTEFIGRAGSGATLPRSNKIQKDKEKLKRSKGQSSHATWKSEEEMLLKQLYD